MQSFVDILIPLTIVLMMFVVGMALTPDDFRRIQSFKKLVIIATFWQVLLLPVVAIGLAWGLNSTPLVTAGLVLVAASPGGAISNYYVYMARANVALSVSLTGVSTLAGFLTLPLVVQLGFWLLFEADERPRLPVMLMIAQLFILLLLPTILGMWLRYIRPQWVAINARLLRRMSVLAMAVIILLVGLEQGGKLLTYAGEVALGASFYTLISMAIGWGVGVALGTGSAERFTLMVEYSLRNLALVSVVGATLLGNKELLVFAAVFFLLQMPFMILATYIRRHL